jgi:hypothetical protein
LHPTRLAGGRGSLKEGLVFRATGEQTNNCNADC